MFPNVRGYTREVKSVGAFRRENGRTLTSLHALYTNSTPTLGKLQAGLEKGEAGGRFRR